MSRRAPVGGPPPSDANLRVGIGIIVVMLLVGFLILRYFGDGQQTNVATATDPTQPDEPVGNGTSLPPTSTSTTVALKPPDTIKVLAVNGTSTTGAANKVSDAITPAGYDVLEAVSSTRAYRNTQAAQATEVLVETGFEREANQLAMALGIPTSALSAFPPDPKSFPFEATESTETANIILVIGADLAANPPPALPSATGGPSSASSTTSTTARRRTTTTTRRRATTTTRRATTTTDAETTTTTTGQ